MSESVETGSTSPNIVAQTRRAAGGGGSVQAAAPGRGWSSWRQTTVPGVWGALVFACLSFTPSLLPRSGLIQGIVAGVTAAIGYGVGLVLAAVWRAFADRDTRPAQPSTWRITWIAGGLVLALFFGLGQYWQHEIRGLMGVTDYNIALVVLSPVVALLVFALLVLLTRAACGRSTGGSHGCIRRWIGPRAANALGWIAVAGAHLPRHQRHPARRAGERRQRDVRGAGTPRRPRGCSNRATALRSGGTGSLVHWDTLGWQGRTFTGTGPTAADITATMHRSAKEPIRAYTGLATAEDAGGQGEARRRRPRARGRVPTREPASRRHDRQRLDQRLLRRHLRVPDRGRLGHRRDAVLLPALVDVLSGGPDQGARGRQGPLRRRLRALVCATGRVPAPPLRQRREPGLVRRGVGVQRRGGPAQPDVRARSSPARPTSTLCSRSSGSTGTSGAWSGCPCTSGGRTVRFTNDATGGDPADGPAVGRHPRAVPHARL